MDILIFRKVFNNNVLNRLIFNQVHHIFIDILKVKKVLKWDKVLESRYYLAGNNYFDLLNQYYQRNNDNNIKYNRRESVLLNALKSKSIDIIKYIIQELKYDFNSYGCYEFNGRHNIGQHAGYDLLSIASQYGNIEIIKYIDSLKINDNTITTNNENDQIDCEWDYLDAFKFSPLSNDFEVVQYLYSKIKENDKLYKQINKYHLISAIRNSLSVGRIDIVEWLFSEISQFEINLNDIDFIESSIKSGKLEVLQYCLTNRSTTNEDYQELYDENLINKAIDYGHLEIIQWLYHKHIDTITITSIETAVKNRQWEVCKWLIFNFPSDRNRITMALVQAFVLGRYDIIKLLQENGFSSPDFISIRYGNRNDYCDNIQIEMINWFMKESGISHTFENLHQLVKFLAFQGNLDALKWLNKRRYHKGWSSKIMDIAAENGHFNLVKWLHKKSIEGCSKNAMDNAAKIGRLDIIKWLHENRTEGCTEYAMENAAEYGYLDTVKWLHENRTEGCTLDAINLASGNGHLDTIKWLHQNRTEAISKYSINSAALSGNMEIIEWFNSHHQEIKVEDDASLFVDLIDDAAINGNLDVIKWLHRNHPNRSEICSANAMRNAAKNGHLNIVKWIHFNRTEGCTSDAMDQTEHLKIVKWLHFNRTEGCSTDAMDIAAACGNDLEMVEWLHFNRTEGCSTEAMDGASGANFLKIVKWLHFNRTEGCTTNAMDIAAYCGKLKTVKFLHENRTEGCTTQAIDVAASGNKHLDTMRWLVMNRTEGFTLVAIESAVRNKNVELFKLLDEKYRQPYPQYLTKDISNLLSSK